MNWRRAAPLQILINNAFCYSFHKSTLCAFYLVASSSSSLGNCTNRTLLLRKRTKSHRVASRRFDWGEQEEEDEVWFWRQLITKGNQSNRRREREKRNMIQIVFFLFRVSFHGHASWLIDWWINPSAYFCYKWTTNHNNSTSWTKDSSPTQDEDEEEAQVDRSLERWFKGLRDRQRERDPSDRGA